MLVLSRKKDETIVINGNIEVTVTKISGNRVTISIDAPKEVLVQRKEILLLTQETQNVSQMQNM